jgi:ABC-2 type transport system ATP-binding protein
MSVATLPERKAATPAAAGAAAEFVKVSKTYRGLPWQRGVAAVRDVSFRIDVGEAFGLVGPNRAGKTTLIKLLLSLCRPTAGEVWRLGRPAAVRATLGQVGYVHERHAFPRYLGAAALLEFYGALSLIPGDVLRQRVPRLLDTFGLADRSREPIARFSKGMLQRLGMAQALLTEPRLLVLDEPTEGLDVDGRQLLREAVAAVRGKGGSVLLVSHALGEVQQLCDRVGVLVDGRLVFVGSLAELTAGSGGGSSAVLEKALARLYARPKP